MLGGVEGRLLRCDRSNHPTPPTRHIDRARVFRRAPLDGVRPNRSPSIPARNCRSPCTALRVLSRAKRGRRGRGSGWRRPAPSLGALQFRARTRRAHDGARSNLSQERRRAAQTDGPRKPKRRRPRTGCRRPPARGAGAHGLGAKSEVSAGTSECGAKPLLYCWAPPTAATPGPRRGRRGTGRTRRRSRRTRAWCRPAPPFAPVEAAVDADRAALGEVAGAVLALRPPDGDAEVVGLVDPLAGCLPCGGSLGDAKAADRGAGLQGPKLRVARQVPGEHDAIDVAGRHAGWLLSRL